MGAVFEGDRQGAGLRLALVVSRFNGDITGRLLEGAQRALAECGVTDVDVVWVPGSFELPIAARRLIETGRCDAVVCLGAVIRHETAHWEHVAREAAAGIQRVALDTGLPVVFGVLTCETHQQALDRAGGAEGNKGHDWALGAVEMARLFRKLGAS